MRSIVAPPDVDHTDASTQSPISMVFGARDDLNLYTYGANDPLTRVDPSGKDAEVTISGDKVTIKIPIQFTGDAKSQSRIDSIKAGIQSQWSGTFGKYQVITTVTNQSQSEDVHEYWLPERSDRFVPRLPRNGPLKFPAAA